MKIRSRLLLLLLPPLTAIILLISFFFYFNWSHEILENFESHPQSISTSEIDIKLNHILLIILLITLIAVIIITVTVFLVANAISRPVQQLNQAALEIASGNYETNIQVQGPIEIVELANTFNTMSDCLMDHMHRLKESSISRKQLYGQNECGRILQNYMLENEIENFSNPCWKAFLATTPISNPSNGLLVRCTEKEAESFTITFFETSDSSFPSLFKLNQTSLSHLKSNNYSTMQCHFHKEGTINYSCQKIPLPLGWSFKNESWISSSPGIIHLEIQDILLIYNSALLNHFETEEAVQVWIGRVLRHFAKEGLSHIETILNNELTFLKRSENSKEKMAILTFMRVL
jgi:HAMP domain-containing protein